MNIGKQVFSENCFPASTEAGFSDSLEKGDQPESEEERKAGKNLRGECFARCGVRARVW
jgi:hypothetical protein